MYHRHFLDFYFFAWVDVSLSYERDAFLNYH